MLHLHTVTIPFVVSDATFTSGFVNKFEDAYSVNGSRWYSVHLQLGKQMQRFCDLQVNELFLLCFTWTACKTFARVTITYMKTCYIIEQALGFSSLNMAV